MFTIRKIESSVPFDDLEKVSTQRNNKILNEDLTLEEILQTTKDINMILDHIGKKNNG